MTIFSELFDKAQQATRQTKGRQPQTKREPKPEPSPKRPPQSKPNSSRTSKQTKVHSLKLQESRSSEFQRTSKRNNEESIPSPSRKRKRRHRHGSSSSSSHQRRPQLSPEAKAASIRLTQQLQECSRQKRLEQALQLYESHGAICDAHHAGIVIDCCARCGAVKEAERIVQDLLNSSNNEALHVAPLTALLKGYAHAGPMHHAARLFRRMCNGHDKRYPAPNVRTLNTLLRGCLWTAAAPSSSNNDEIVGGVVTSEEAWSLYGETVGVETLDSSSYEMSVAILCQALRTTEAEQRMAAFQARHGIRFRRIASLVGSGDQASLESLASMQLGLARAHLLLGQFDNAWKACQRSISAVQASRAASSTTEPAFVQSGQKAKKKQKVQGGKQSWKKSQDEDGDGQGSQQRREASNAAFRAHRLAELDGQARELLKLRGQDLPSSYSSRNLAQCLLSRFFYFSGGGTTDLKATTQGSKDHNGGHTHAALHCLTSAWYSFGLSQLVPGDFDGSKLDVARVYDAVSLGDRRFLHRDGRIDFGQVFPSSRKNRKRPLMIELGSGFGDWIVHQARSKPSHDYVAVELRADRVFQIFCQAVLLGGGDEPLKNVCVVGSECGCFLRERVQQKAVSHIFANFPEPPTQVYGRDDNALEAIVAGGAEPAHMLNSSTLQMAAGCLQIGGKIVFVTDNKVYAKLLCATFVKTMRKLKDDIRLRSLSHSEVKESGLRPLETFSRSSKDRLRVVLFEGRPNEYVGHFNSNNQTGNSYFDRLWRSGASNHSERQTRFVIITIRC